MGQAEDDMITFVMKMKEEFEELKSTVKDLSTENAELKAENFDLKKNIQKLESVVAEVKAKGDDFMKDVQEMKAENAKQMEITAASLSELTMKNDQLECKATEIVRDVSFLKNSPYYHICVYQHFTSVTKSNVQFEKELYSDCNMCNGEEGNRPANF